ncbi:GNAT family N-acetyltransferase [Thermoflavimicrobium dichotomicum]|uniref:Phosphinothricin acetyltransferase n=1 Tax=Thermoflavimicrobium dichotomicum TaxID=46223 RepID=A0A1I3LYW6_9BACL|nr:GNAT family N-acetyltransferase [Thermoflavimicrobium dichotomicum]SFI89626.1 phosphinothricin acetyltransferase [Thermoflavimicrobium dichotomicum]
MLILRDTHETDLQAIIDIYNHAVIHTTATFDLEPQTLEQRKQWFVKNEGRYPFIVAELEGKVVGFSSLSQFRSKPAYNSTAELSIYVDPECKGQGIGKQLMQEIIERAKQKKFHAIVSSIADGNVVSMKLHEKFGFQRVGSFREIGFKFDRWIDVHFYQLILGIHDKTNRNNKTGNDQKSLEAIS